MAKAKKWKVPKTLGACADSLYALRGQRAELNKRVKAIEEFEKAIKEKLISDLPKSRAEGVTGKVARAVIKTKKIGTVADWDKLYKHIKKTNDFSLLHRRLADASVQEQWDNGKKIPGVESFTLLRVSVTKK